MAGNKASRARCSIKAVALGVSLVVSALITAATLRSPDLYWLAWFSFLPLFVAVRSLRSLMAALAGGLWGACLYLFTTAGSSTAVEGLASAIGPSAWLLALLIVIPAVYLGLAAAPARAVGCKLLTLALGWTLVEVVIHVFNESGSHDGLLAGSQVEGPQFHWLARLVGYVATAFLVGCVNTSLIRIVRGARVSFPAHQSLPGLRNAFGRFPSQVVLAMQSRTHRQAYPRAPPIPVSAARLNLVGNAL